MNWLIRVDPGRVAVVVQAKNWDEARALGMEIAQAIGGAGPGNWGLKGWIHDIRRLGQHQDETEQ